METKYIVEVDNIETNNKLIAEFMGYDIIMEAEKDKFPTVLTTKDVKYHTSWDWLMQVVEKCLIGEAEHDEEISHTIIANIYEGICNQDIPSTHKAVVEFIKYYNLNK